MASTYSDLKIELIGTGEQSGTWGTTTNTNLGTAIEEAITGSATVSFSSADVTLTLTNTNASQTARNLRIVCTGTSGGARQLILDAGCQIEKLYLVQNDLADAVTVINGDGAGGTSGTGVTIPAGDKRFVFNDATNIVEGTSAVYGPASSTDNAVARFDGTTGQLIQNSGVTIDDSNNVTGVAQLDATTLEVTNIKAKDGTAAIAIADSTGITTQSTPAVISVDSSSDALRITQVGTGNALVVEDSANPDATPFVINASGFVSMGGATAPTVGGIGIKSATAFGPQVTLYNSVNDANPSYKIHYKDRAGSIVQSGDSLGIYAFFGYDGAAYKNAAQIVAVVDGTPGTNDMPGRLVFSTTADGGSSPTERMRIDSSGNVGIGTTSPSAQLNLSAVDSATIRFTSTDTTSANNQDIGVIEFEGSDTSNDGVRAKITATYAGTAGQSRLQFYTQNTGASSPIEQFRIDNTSQLWATIQSEVGTDYATIYKGYFARAWVNFNGTGTVAIRASGNVSSITDNGAGNYTVNFTTAMPDTDYGAVATCNLTVGFSAVVIPTSAGTTKSTSACRAQFWTASGGVDVSEASFAIFR